MVKVDASQDYYAALGCKPTADTNELRRNFRTLALKYHPDRNPGKEEEFNSKFQAIQAAHEVLTDEAQRAKYDLERAKLNAKLRDYTSPTRPHVPTRAPASNFPPPPRPPPPPAGFKSAYPRHTNTYRQHQRADAANSYPPEDNKSKANAFKAWEQMRHGQGPTPRAPPPKVPPRNPPPRSTPTATAEEPFPKEAPRRPSWNPTDPLGTIPRRSNTTRVPRKTAFANGDSGAESPTTTRHSAYANVARGERPGVSRPTTVHDPPMTDRNRPDPLRPFKESNAFSNPWARSERISTPYATSGGEKTYFSSQALHRTTSGRNSAEMPDVEFPQENGIHGRETPHSSNRTHRSASPKFRSPPHPATVSSSSSSESSSEDELFPASKSRPQKVPTSRLKARNPAGSSRVPTFGTSVRMDDGTTANPAQRVRSNPNYVSGVNNVPSGFSQPFPPPKTAPAEGFAQHRLRRESGQTFARPQSAYATDVQDGNVNGTQRPMQRPRSWDAKYGGAVPDSSNRDTQSTARPLSGTQPERPKIFTFPASNPDQKTHPPPFRSQSSETINTNFSPGGFQPTFASTPPTPRDSREPSRVRTSPVKQQPPYARQPQTHNNVAPNGNTGQTANVPGSQPSNHDRYRNEDWAKHFQPETNTYYPPPPSRSPTRATTRKRPNTPARPFGPATKRPAATPQANDAFIPANVSESTPETSEPTTATQSTDGKTTVDDDSAMDIDTPPSKPASAPKAPTPPVQSHDRRPSFQAEQIGVSSRPSGPPIPPRPRSHVDTAANGEPSTAPTSAPPTTSQPADEVTNVDTASVDHSNHLNLSSLKSTTPFTPSNGTSINNLTDLSDSLPFPSRPSEVPPAAEAPHPSSDLPNVIPKSATDLPSTSTSSSTTTTTIPQLNLPKPPRGPPPPTGTLSTLRFERYLADMRTYMHEWNAYNGIMLAHFNARQARAVESLASSSPQLQPPPSTTGLTSPEPVVNGLGGGLSPLPSPSASALDVTAGMGMGDWMSATGNAGYQSYMRGLEEDERVREHWGVSWERHRDVVRRLGEVRERVKMERTRV